MTLVLPVYLPAQLYSGGNVVVWLEFAGICAPLI